VACKAVVYDTSWKLWRSTLRYGSYGVEYG
jgi:hypothetical protein